MLGGGSAQDMDAEKGPFLQVEGAASQLGQLLLELGIVSTRDVLDREPFVLAEGQLARHRGGGSRASRRRRRRWSAVPPGGR